MGGHRKLIRSKSRQVKSCGSPPPTQDSVNGRRGTVLPFWATTWVERSGRSGRKVVDRSTGQPISDRSKENGRRWRPRCSYFDWRSSASWGATVPHSKLRHRLRCRYATARNARLALSSQYPCRELCNAAASGWRTPPSAPATSPKQALVLFARISPRGSCAVAATTSAIPTRLLITAPSKALRDSTSIIACLA